MKLCQYFKFVNMIIIFIYLKSVKTEVDWISSSIIRDNKLICILYTLELYYVKISVFDLREGTTKDIFDSRKTFNITRTDKNVALTFLDIYDSLKEDKGKLWVKFEFRGYKDSPNTSPFMSFVGYIDLDDMSLKNDSSLIRFPTHENFPVKGYTIDIITNEFGPVMYVVGGERYSKKNNNFTVSNSFYKYNFTTKEWTDMAYTINKKLKPLSDHKSVVIDNRYLVIMVGKERIFYDPVPDVYDVDHPIYEYYSIYDLTIYDTFTKNWEIINIKPSIFDIGPASIEFKGFMPAVYKEKIYVLGGDVSKSRSSSLNSNLHLGILDLKSKKWTWAPLLYEDETSVIKSNRIANIQVFNGQIIISDAVFIDESLIPIYVYDIPNQIMRSRLRLSNPPNDTIIINENNETQDQLKILPVYAIVLISLSCAVLLTAFIYLTYRKIKSKIYSKNKTRSNAPIREVWSNPGIDDISNIILWDKTKGLSVKNNNSISLKSNRPDFSTSVAINTGIVEFNK